MTYIDKIMRRFSTVPEVPNQLQVDFRNIIFPPMCGICEKLNDNFLCKKCEILLNEHAVLGREDYKECLDMYFDEHVFIFNYEGIVRSKILDYKFGDKSYLYKTFSNFILKNKIFCENLKSYDIIIPVPISKARYKKRGYNQSLLISREISKKLPIDIVNNCLFKTKNIIEQSKLNKEERSKNIIGVYKLENKEQLENKKILIFDDIFTTGSTVNECSKMIRQASPKKIGILTLAKD